MDISQRIIHLKELIRREESFYQRPEGSVKLLAVSKGQPSERIIEAYQAGLHDFGESYLQEALEKINALKNLKPAWHFIGPIQSNKAATIAQYFTWVHSLSRPKIAEKLNLAREKIGYPLHVCLQVNIDNEATKSGLSIEEVEELAAFVFKLPYLRLRGLMAIPQYNPNEQEQYLSFLRLNELLQYLNKKFNNQLDTLSMGMSSDWPAAIHAGSTIIRIGTAIFGTRT
jgi:pyridoxal phosphate enzyme (YggS family)